MSYQKTPAGTIVLPRRAPRNENDYNHQGRWTGGYYKRPTKPPLTPADNDTLNLLAASGATWADIAHVAHNAHLGDLESIATQYIEKGHGDRYALRYTHFILISPQIAAQAQELFAYRLDYEHEPASFAELRQHQVDAYVEAGGRETYTLDWLGKHAAILEALEPADPLLRYMPVPPATSEATLKLAEHLANKYPNVDGLTFKIDGQEYDAAVFLKRMEDAA